MELLMENELELAHRCYIVDLSPFLIVLTNN